MHFTRDDHDRCLGTTIFKKCAGMCSMSRIDCPKLSREMHRHYVLSTGTTALQGRQGEDEQEARSLKQMLKEFQQRQLTGQHAPSAKAFQTAPQEPESGPDPAAAAAVKQARVLMGYITSEAPQGLLGRGACGVCLEASLAALRAQQTPGKEERWVLIAYRSPLSSLLRLAEARIVL